MMLTVAAGRPPVVGPAADSRLRPKVDLAAASVAWRRRGHRGGWFQPGSAAL